jgi:hypothetical protein
MSTSFGILFSLKIAHSRYPGACTDIEYNIPSDTAELLRNRRIITRTDNGSLFFLCEKNDTGVPVVPVTGITFRIGLKLSNPNFYNFTKIDFKDGTTPLYRNLTTPTVLDLPVEMLLAGALFAYPLTKTGRPVTVSVKDSGNNILKSSIIADAGNNTPVPFDLTGYPPGVYSLNEKLGSSTKKSLFYVDPELARLQTFGIVEIKVADSFFTPNPPEFSLNFSAKQETLKYYILGKNYTAAEMNHLSVSDAGFNEDARPQVMFTKVSQGAFAATDISPSLLTGTNSRVILFKSQSPVSRLEKSRRKIQLSYNSDVIIKHLPSPGTDKCNSDIIIQISKP